MIFRIPKPLRILLVTDDESGCHLIRRLLTEAMPSCVDLERASGFEAGMRMAEGFPHDIYLLDCHFGHRSGLDLLRGMIQKGCIAPIIMLNGHNCYETDLEAMRSGAADFLDKDCLTGALLERAIRYALMGRQIREAIARAKREWEQTFDTVSDLIAIIDSNHRLVRVNMALARRLKTTPDRIVGRTCYEVMHETTSPPSFCPHTRLLNDGREHSAEIYEKNLGGYFLVSVTPYYDEQSRMFGSVHVARDINARKKAEEAVRTANAALEDRVALRTAELEAKAKELEDANTALRVLLRRREEDKGDIEKAVLANADGLIKPYLERLRQTRLSRLQMNYVATLEDLIDRITSPLIKSVSDRCRNLTPMELQVIGMIKAGKSNKEMADLLNLSENTIKFHRLNIRSKLGIRGKRQNLRSVLASFTK